MRISVFAILHVVGVQLLNSWLVRLVACVKMCISCLSRVSKRFHAFSVKWFIVGHFDVSVGQIDAMCVSRVFVMC